MRHFQALFRREAVLLFSLFSILLSCSPFRFLYTLARSQAEPCLRNWDVCCLRGGRIVSGGAAQTAEAGGGDGDERLKKEGAALQDRSNQLEKREKELRLLFPLPPRRRPLSSPNVAAFHMRGLRTFLSNRDRVQTGRARLPRPARPGRKGETRVFFSSPFFLSTAGAEGHSSWRSSFHDFLVQKNTKTARLARWQTTPSTWSNRNLQNVRGGRRDRGLRAPCIAGEGGGGAMVFARVLREREGKKNSTSSISKKHPPGPCYFYQKRARFFFFFFFCCSSSPLWRQLLMTLP